MSSPATPRPAPVPWWQPLDPRVSLPARATLFLGGAALALVLFAAQLAGTLLRGQLERQLGATFENLAGQLTDKLDRSLYERARALHFTASLSAFRTTTTPAAERQTILESLHDTSPDYAWVGLTDASGTVVAASQRLFEGEKKSDTPWFSGARRSLHVGTVREFPELARAVPTTGGDAPRFLDLAVPVTAPDGKFLGVLGAQIRWSWARDIEFSVLPESARRERLGLTLYSDRGDVLLDSGSSGWTAPPDLPADLSARRGHLVENAAGGTVYLSGYSHSRGFRDYRGQGWTAVVRQPVTAAFAPVQQLRQRITVIGLLLVVAIGTLTWIVTARLERRFRAVALAADRIGTGDILSLMPLAHGDSAYARMCTALATMVDSFRRRQESLEQENARLAARPRTEPKP